MPVTVGLHAVISPFSPANMNRAAAELAPTDTTNAVVLPLNTVPVGAPPSMLTTSDCLMGEVLELYNVERSVALSDTHSGVVGPWVRPQALTRLGSVTGANPATSDTRLTWVYRLVLAEPSCLTVAPAGEDVASARADARATATSGRAENMRPPR